VAERLNTARRLVTESDFDGASAILERLVTLGVATGPVYTQLGAIYMAQGATERALGLFEEALASDPSDLFARVCRGEARLWRGDLRLAREDLQRVLDMGTAGSPLVERAQQLLQRLKEQGDRKRS
jgi:Tfp pilus assembly protein PilF